MLVTFLKLFFDEISVDALDFCYAEKCCQYFSSRAFHLKIISKTILTFGNTLYISVFRSHLDIGQDLLVP